MTSWLALVTGGRCPAYLRGYSVLVAVAGSVSYELPEEYSGQVRGRGLGAGEGSCCP